MTARLILISCSFITYFYFNNCRAQSAVICDSSGIIEYYDSITKSDKVKCVFIQLSDGFNDTLEIYLNGALQSRAFYKTNFSKSTAGKAIVYDYRKLNQRKRLNLVIREISNKYCLNTNLERGYKIANVYYLNNKWIISYTNKKGLVIE